MSFLSDGLFFHQWKEEQYLWDQVLRIDRNFLHLCWDEKQWSSLEHFFLGLLMDQKRVLGFSLFYTVKGNLNAHLLKLVIDPSVRRHGWGEKLLDWSWQRLSHEYQHIFLEVEASNTAARKFYCQQGFQLIHQKAEYYSNGETAYIMLR